MTYGRYTVHKIQSRQVTLVMYTGTLGLNIIRLDSM